MLKTTRLIALAATAALAVPALAGSWPSTPPRKADPKPAAVRVAPAQLAPASQRAIADFEYVGGETGWQLAQHKYELAGGRFVMSDECDHAIRIVSAPTPEEVESTRGLSPGA